MKLDVTITTILCSLSFLPSLAVAQDQPWLKDRRYTEGIGIRSGDFELHPGIAGEFGYDTNYLHRSDDAEGTVGALRLRVTPSFSISTIGQQRRETTPDAPPPDVEFRGGLSFTYDEFFPLGCNTDTQGRCDQLKDIMSEQRNIGGTLDLKLTINPQRPWSGTLDAELGRSIAPSDQGLTDQSFRRISAGGGGELIWTPGGGLLDWRLGYHFSGTFFESSNFASLTNLNHTVSTKGRWRFLPRTALMYDARFGFVNYPSGDNASHPLQAQLGINGLVTPSFGILALAGWGASFYTAPEAIDFDSVIGQLELKWYLTPNPSTDPMAAGLALSSLATGFIRDFHDSYIGTYFERDRGYVKFTYFFGGRFLLVLDGGFGAIIYPDTTETAGGFTVLHVDASLLGEYRLKDYLGLNATVRYGTDITDKVINENRLQWQQFEAYLGARLMW